MNGKLAKMLRRGAEKIAENTGTPLQTTYRKINKHNKNFVVTTSPTDRDYPIREVVPGMSALARLFQAPLPLSRMVQLQLHQKTMNPCMRKIYKNVKKQMKQSKSSSTQNEVTIP